MTQNTGGPAFPRPASTDEANTCCGVFYDQEGMSLRDWFAGQALNGMLAHSTRYRPLPTASQNWHEAISEEAYQIADAMLAEREK
jgi:hypothetical protein